MNYLVQSLLILILSLMLVKSVVDSSLKLSKKELLDLQNKGEIELPNGSDSLDAAVAGIIVRTAIFAVWLLALILGLVYLGLQEYLVLGYLLLTALIVSVLFYKIALRLVK